MSLRSIKSEEFFIDADMCEWANAEMLKTGRRIDWKRVHQSSSRMPHEHVAVPVGKPGRLHPTQKPKDIPLIVLNGALYQWYMTTIDATTISEQTPKDAVVAFLMNISPGLLHYYFQKLDTFAKLLQVTSSLMDGSITGQERMISLKTNRVKS